ncbi:phosphatase PAP2 family protein [Thiotrichales bacterium 19S3-7]|nr:phosphatase PAP2 family protein [Thiotrichales bacterium 19S3-7]MCF6800778.1 phosphatase PAP2 family protein [Thiotrichales bacterium 19S3-11]
MLKFIKPHINVLIALVVYAMVFINQWVVEDPSFIWWHVALVIILALGFYALSILLKWLFDFKTKKTKYSIEYIATAVIAWLPYLILICGIVVYFQMLLPLTPYPRIDPYLHRIDQLFGFDEGGIILDFQNQFSFLSPYFIGIYNQLNTAIILTIALIPIFNWKSFERMFRIFFILIAITIVFYYFLPSYGPVYYFKNIHFNSGIEQMLTSELALEANHSLAPVYGIIACPSWHVLCALLIIFAWWPVKFYGLRYLILVFSILLILSIFPTGEHYLADALCSFILFAIVYSLDKKISAIYNKNEQNL